MTAKRLGTVGVAAIFLLLPAPGGTSPLDELSIDTISISADEAREDEDSDILHFSGRFIMHSSDWRLTSRHATVYGRPDRPDKVHLEGVPAHFRINRTDSDGDEQVEAIAPVVDYVRSANLLKLSGGAVLKLGDEAIHSDTIEYNISTNRYRASGAGGVTIEVPSKDQD